MTKRVIVIVLLLVLALFVYVGYNSYDTKRAGTSGEVYSNGVRRSPASDPKAQASEDTIVYPSASDTAAAAQPAQAASAAEPGQAANTGCPKELQDRPKLRKISNLPPA